MSLPRFINLLPLWSLWLSAGALLAEEPAVSKRAYRDGPLMAADFAAARPADAQTVALSELEYEWKYQYRHELRGATRVVTLTEVEVWAAIRRDKSWNLRPRDALILDHEQGHFDIAQTFALQAQAKLLADRGTVAVLQARGANLNEAVKRLEAELAKALQTLLDPAQQVHRDYDKATDRGDDASAQAIARKAQRAALQAITEKLETLDK